MLNRPTQPHVRLPHLRRILGVVIGACLLLTGCAAPAVPSAPPAPARPLTLPLTLAAPGVPANSLAPDRTDGIQVWFTNPLGSAAERDPQANLVRAIAGARKSVDVAIYNLTLPSVGDALIQAHRRGVQVRIAMESEAMDKSLPRKIAAAGIPIVGDQREGLMHDKFTIIDGSEVWTGSMNYTATSDSTDFNNLLRIRSTLAARDYQAEFNQMFVEQRFGPDKQPVAPQHKLSVGDIPIEIYFSPDDGVSAHLLGEIQQAHHSIDVLAYSFTSSAIVKALIAKDKAGVTVRGVFDQSQNKDDTGNAYAQLKRAGLDVRLSGIQGLAHDKVMLIDGQVVLTGSYNFTVSAERYNDENLVILRDASLAAQYRQHFETVYASSQK